MNLLLCLRLRDQNKLVLTVYNSSMIAQEKIFKTIEEMRSRYIPGSKVLLGLSGGVDSAVAGWLLKEAGYDVVGVFLICYPKTPGCRTEQDHKDAVVVASQLGIPLFTMDFVKEYEKEVLSNFYDEYRAGRTPNPDVLCNERIKFGVFFEKVMSESQAVYFATGHYARVDFSNGRSKLRRAFDETKDQSYFLYRVGYEELSRTIFPLGGFTKEEVRAIAKDQQIVVSNKPDSTGICFIGQVDLFSFAKDRIDNSMGRVLDKEGNVVGEHRGVGFYTVGQRRGYTSFVNEPMYVIKKDVENNVLVVGGYGETFVESFFVREIFWRNIVNGDSFEAQVRIRNLGKLVKAMVSVLDNRFLVTADESIQAPAPGQSAVFYRDDVLIAGGLIE